MIEAHQYAHWVLDPANEKLTGRLIKLAAKRFLSDLERDDVYFDEKEANRMPIFCARYLRQWEGDWRGNLLKFEPWQLFIFQQVYGWIKKENGRRRFTRLYVQIAKKNGKSTMAAGLGLYHLFADPRINTPKVFTAANNEDQAKICVNMAGRIVEQSEALYELVEEGKVRLRTYGVNITDVIHDEKDGFIKALSKESDDKKSKQAGGKHGINASMGIVDEFGMSPDHGASKTISTSMAARNERLMAYITTAGFNKDGPCFRELRKTGIDVLEGQTIADEYLPIIYEIDDGDNYKNPDCWHKCNPNLGISVSREFLQEQVNDAARLGGSTEVDVKTLNFNLWVDAPNIWISPDVWKRNTHGISEDELQGRECFGGLHIISSRELNCLSLFFPNIRDNLHAVKMIFWMPSDAVIDNQYKMDFDKWVKEGSIEVCAGNVIDNEYVFSVIEREISKYSLHSIAFPVNVEKHDITQALVLNGVQCNPISQGYKGNSIPTFLWEGFLNAGQIEHFNNPVLAWSNANCMVLRKGDDIRIERAAARTAGIVSCINAVAQWKTFESEMMNSFSFK
jgi:phage terminase large subunit-like protein